MTAQSPAKSRIENSLSVRLASLVLSLLSISLACHYVMLPRPLAFTYIFICLLGSFCAYYFRKKEYPWITLLAVLGTLLVMGNFAQEIFFQFYVGRLNPIGPFISVLAGLLALHTLDLRTRLDVNTAALIGLGLMACIGMLANDIIFGVSVLLYLLIGAVLLYFQCISSSLVGVSKRKGDQAAPPYGITQSNVKRTLGSNILAIVSLPILALLLFINLPRIDSLIDRLVVELTARGFPFRVMITGATELIDNVSGNATLQDLYGNGPGYGKGSGGSAGTGSGSQANTGGEGKQSTVFGLQIASSNKGNGTSGGGTTPSGGGYGLGNLGGNMPPLQGKASQPEVAAEYNQIEPANKEEMMLLFQDKKARAQDSTVLFTMTASREVFLKRLVFDYFDGHNWRAQEHGMLMAIDLTPDALSDLSSAPPLNRPRGGSVDVPQEITANVNLGHVIPAASIPQKIQFPTEQIFVDKYGCLRTSGTITGGTKFKLISKIPIYNPKHLILNTPSSREEGQAQAAFKSDLQVPSDLGIEVGYLAKAIVGSEKNWFSQSQRVCDYLRNNFEYSLDTPSPETNENAVRHFLLVTKKGDCTEFASAFVMLCRTLGIPSRCVGGFAPGTRNLVTGLTELRWRDSHAWAEVFIPRFGWVPFDAVPGGYLPSDRPERNILASLARTQLAKSLAKAVEDVAKAKGLKRLDEELESEDTVSHAAATGSQPPPAKTKPQAAPSRSRPEQNVVNDSDKPLLRIDGLATGRTQKIDSRLFPRLFHLAPLQSFDLSWLATYWRPSVAMAVLVVIAAFLLWLVRQKHSLFEGKFKPAKKTTPKYSTLAFMRVMNDLARLKIKRGKGDTAQEVVDKVVKRLAEIERPAWQQALPHLLTSFMEIYCLNRFAETESPQDKAKLQDIEKEIHLLLTSA
jgi:hypothetical protein